MTTAVMQMRSDPLIGFAHQSQRLAVDNNDLPLPQLISLLLGESPLRVRLQRVRSVAKCLINNASWTPCLPDSKTATFFPMAS